MIVLSRTQPWIGMTSRISPYVHSRRDPHSENKADTGHLWATIAWRIGRLNEPVRVRWPIPGWTSFWEYSLFLAAWNDIVDQVPETTLINPQPAMVEWFAFAWVNAATAVVSGFEPLPLKGPPSFHFEQDGEGEKAQPIPQTPLEPRKFNIGDEDLKNLLHSLSALVGENSRDTPRGRRILDWVARLCLFLAPEYGLDVNTRRRLELIASQTRIQYADHPGTSVTPDLRPKTLYEVWWRERVYIRDLREVGLAAVGSRYPAAAEFLRRGSLLASDATRAIFVQPPAEKETGQDESDATKS